MSRLADVNAALSTLEQESLVQGRRPGIWACPREECGVESTMRHAIHHTDACPFSLIVTDQPSAAPGTTAAGQDQRLSPEQEAEIRETLDGYLGCPVDQCDGCVRYLLLAELDATRTSLAQARADVAALRAALRLADDVAYCANAVLGDRLNPDWQFPNLAHAVDTYHHHKQPGASPAAAAQALVLAEQRSAIQDAVRQGEKARFDNLDPAGAHRRALDGLRTLLATPPAAAVEQAAAVLKAGEAMADAIQRGTRELPRGGMTGGGDPPYSETWRMFRQSLDDYRRAVAALRGAGSGEAS